MAKITLQELKHWIETLPSEADDYVLVIAEYGEMNPVELWYRKDIEVSGLSIDEDTKEILIIR